MVSSWRRRKEEGRKRRVDGPLAKAVTKRKDRGKRGEKEGEILSTPH